MTHVIEGMVEVDHGVDITTFNAAQMRAISWTGDVLIYIVILNLFAELAPDHISIDSFWITLLVAVLFKVLLAGMDGVKRWLQGKLRSRNREVLAAVGVLPVFFVGKLLILESADAVFDQVSLNGFWYEWFLIFFLIVIPAIAWALFDWIGDRNGTAH